MINDEILIRYFTNQATTREQEAVETFQQASPEEFKILKKIWTNKDQIHLKTFDKTVAWQKVAAATVNKQQAKVRQLINYRIAAAASIALLISVGIWFLISFNQKNTWDTYTADNSPINLSDGTQVWLNDGASLEVPRKFKRNLRQVRLSGEAFFDVAKRTDQAFIIDNEQLKIEVLGTSFNVQANQVTVASGTVMVRNAISTDSILLEKGESTILEGQDLISQAVDPNFQAWRTGIFQFDNVPILSVLKDLNRYYKDSFALQAIDSNCLVNIDFNQEERSVVKQALELICEINLD